MVQAKLDQVGFLCVHKIETAFLKLKPCPRLFKKLENYIESSYVSPEASESVSDNSEITQLLSHDCRTISKNFREKNILSLKVDFYLSEKCSILIHFSSILEKNEVFDFKRP